MNPKDTTETFEELREKILSVTGMCSGPFEHQHKCSAIHCDHCGLCDYSEEIIRVVTTALDQAVVEAYKALAADIKVAIRADYERLAKVVMRKEQFRFSEETYGYRTIDQCLQKRFAALSSPPQALKELESITKIAEAGYGSFRCPSCRISGTCLIAGQCSLCSYIPTNFPKRWMWDEKSSQWVESARNITEPSKDSKSEGVTVNE